MIIWIDLLQPSGSDLEWLAKDLDLHPLAVEDARVLVTVRKDPVDLGPVVARWDAGEPDIDMGHLVYGLLDALVDGQFDAAIQISDMIQDFEDNISDRSYREKNKGHGFDLRKCLIQMHHQHRRHDRPHHRRLHPAPETPLALRHRPGVGGRRVNAPRSRSRADAKPGRGAR